MELNNQINVTPKAPERRSFVLALFAISGATVGALLAIPLIRFVTYPLRKSATDESWSDVGPIGDFTTLTAPVAKTITLERRDAWQTTSSQTAVYVLPSKDGQLRILSPICPHLGCSVRWDESQTKFICPCHAGSFTADGDRISGPPPRSMDTLEAKVEDGTLKVRYQYFRQLVATKEEMA
ncbi:MAG TPA: ubiquinol-cytochrome c reductase iron-sulfur subunit [Acidobacteriaceae bacterium]|jgi:menaquinol-cytochrome c reductase iron-sulfur subunit|nr:ubiquinol-cytochrome c reductase iron-sulfur subunit [Acidobacteriaceae bacterium]